MKKTLFYAGIIAVMVWVSCLRASASGLGDIRVNARFLTDRMALELNLSPMQCDDLFEINFDFLTAIDPYMSGYARQDAYALAMYSRYLDERNDDLRWILSRDEYLRFIGLDYFFHPVYRVRTNLCGLTVYRRYPDRHIFHYARPHHYHSYCGAHSRYRHGGRSFYHSHYSGRYSHPVYREEIRRHPADVRPDFGRRSPRHEEHRKNVPMNRHAFEERKKNPIHVSRPSSKPSPEYRREEMKRFDKSFAPSREKRPSMNRRQVPDEKKQRGSSRRQSDSRRRYLREM